MKMEKSAQVAVHSPPVLCVSDWSSPGPQLSQGLSLISGSRRDPMRMVSPFFTPWIVSLAAGETSPSRTM